MVVQSVDPSPTSVPTVVPTPTKASYSPSVPTVVPTVAPAHVQALFAPAPFVLPLPIDALCAPLVGPILVPTVAPWHRCLSLHLVLPLGGGHLGAYRVIIACRITPGSVDRARDRTHRAAIAYQSHPIFHRGLIACGGTLEPLDWAHDITY
jgi:hypothetical protein